VSDSGDRRDDDARGRGRNDRRQGDSRQGDSRPSSGRPTGGRPAAGRPTGGRPTEGRPTSGRPAAGRPDLAAGSDRAGRPERGGRPDRAGAPRDSKGRDARPQRDSGARDGGGRDARVPRDDKGRSGPGLWTKHGVPARGDRDGKIEEPEDRDPFNIRSVRTRHDDPEIPESVTAADLDRVARNELKTLEKENAEGVARHLAMAANLIEIDPPLAHRHALSAARRAGRIGVVRETLAITAYAIGDFALALRELRTYRRITGRDDELPMMVDCERGLGRPQKALELGRTVAKSSLPVAVQVELSIAMSGARLDLGQLDAALTELEIPQLDPSTAFSYSPALFDAYGIVLEELGRHDEAELWYERADAAADAIERAEDPDGGDSVVVFEEDASEEGAAAEYAAELVMPESDSHEESAGHDGV
jgi:tetratricopeptide (TPR) repeat protein